MSGLQVNLGKTKIAPFGHKLNLNFLEQETGLQIVNSFKLLGCIFDTNIENMGINFTNAINSIRKEVYLWLSRHLSIKGKITVIKTYALSKLNHIVTIIPTISKKHITDLETIFTKFINSSRHLYPKDLIFRPTNQGGLG